LPSIFLSFVGFLSINTADSRKRNGIAARYQVRSCSLRLLNKINDILKGKAYICSSHFIMVLFIQEA